MSLDYQEDSSAYYPFEQTLTSSSNDIPRYKPVIGISMGDFNGIGPEVILKTLSDTRILSHCIPVIFGAARVFAHYKKTLQLDFAYQQYSLSELPTTFHEQKCNIVNCCTEMITVQEGKITTEAGRCALASLEGATKAMQNGWIDAILTAPINKDNIQADTFKFPGHTEYLTKAFCAKESLMFLVHENLRVGVVTGHIPLNAVAQSVTQEKIAEKLRIMLHSLRQDFGIEKPKVAVLGLNPHAGENGLLGNEEQDIIQPVIEQFRKSEELVYGAFPADGFFGAHQYQKFDAVLAMYHDQGLIPFKTLAFNEGVNFTAGLPIVRTSPDHGTAYNIAGKGIADETSFRTALFVAVDTLKNRKRYREFVEAKASYEQRRKEFAKKRL